MEPAQTFYDQRKILEKRQSVHPADDSFFRRHRIPHNIHGDPFLHLMVAVHTVGETGLAVKIARLYWEK
jgi:hypothetical protein